MSPYERIMIYYLFNEDKMDLKAFFFIKVNHHVKARKIKMALLGSLHYPQLQQ